MDSSIPRFWNEYIVKTSVYELKPGVDRCYVRHAESTIRYHEGIRLSTHEPEHVEVFLTEKGRSKSLVDWQFIQIVQAIELLFLEMVKTSWAVAAQGWVEFTYRF